MFNNISNTDVKGRILLVARELFIEKGYDSTSVRDIAAAAETSVAMVNYYYRSKYNLFEIIFEEALNILFRRVFTALDSDKPIFELIESWISSYYKTLMEYPQIPIFLLKEINQDPKGLTERLMRHDPQKIYARVVNRLEEEAEKGTICNTSPIDLLLNVLSLCIFPFMFGVMASQVAGKSIEEYHEVTMQHKDYVVDFVIKALRP